MSVGVLLISHPGIGAAVYDNAKRIFGNLPLSIKHIEVDFDADIELATNAVYRLATELESGDGVLLLLDLYGASPSQVAGRLKQFGIRMRRVSGLNLPMLLRVLNYADQNLDELALTAAGGARGGVILDDH